MCVYYYNDMNVINYFIIYFFLFESLFLLFFLDIGRKKLIKKVRMNLIFFYILEKMYLFWILSLKDSFFLYNVF